VTKRWNDHRNRNLWNVSAKNIILFSPGPFLPGLAYPLGPPFSVLRHKNSTPPSAFAKRGKNLLFSLISGVTLRAAAPSPPPASLPTSVVGPPFPPLHRRRQRRPSRQRSSSAPSTLYPSGPPSPDAPPHPASGRCRGDPALPPGTCTTQEEDDEL
jgi:hypothetical protein